MINADTFLKIGDQHKICEDYVIAGVTKQGDPPLQYIILSDGCSKSDRTEMGARILCYMAQQYIRFNFYQYPFRPDYKMMGLWIIHNAEMMARNLGLNRDSLDATLIISWIDWFTEEGLTVPFSNIYIYGDAVVGHKKKEGFQTLEIDYPPANAPYYLSYELDPARKQAYHELKVSKVLKFTDPDGTVAREQWAYDSPTTLMANMRFDNPILMASDGLASFYAQAGHAPPIAISASSMVPEFLSFKGTKGSFLQRRASKAIQKARKDREVYHFDDISLGAYIWEGPEDGDISTEQPIGRPEVSEAES